MQKLTVHVEKTYDILIENGLLAQCGAQVQAVSQAGKVCLISDSNVYPIYGERVEQSLKEAGFQVCTLVFEAGEESKTCATVVRMVEFMAENGLTRRDLAVALGGGVCGDMAGFAAAVYLRGIDFVQIPTTLLSQVDSSVGGKTGVDLPQGKNLCGAFHQPVLVLIDPDVLKTLPEHYFSDGMGEVIKYGCIKSRALFERIEREDVKTFMNDLIYECVDIKRQIVERDEKEAGERMLLNFGHTAGHAIEKLWDFRTVSHGEAVGIGMLMITAAGERAGITAPGTAARIEKVLQKYNMPVADTHTVNEIVEAMKADKKRTGTGINLTMLRELGSSFVQPTSYAEVRRLFGATL